MNNEPCPNCGEYHSCTELIKKQQAEIEALKAKTLTDEEIGQVWKITPSYEDRPDYINFARAILRKAQE